MARQTDFGITGVENIQYDSIVHGEFIAGTVAAVMGTAQVRMLWLKAALTNSGTIFVGKSTVTTSDGTADVTTGYPLSAGEAWGPIPVTNVSILYTVASAAAQRGEWFGVI